MAITLDFETGVLPEIISNQSYYPWVITADDSHSGTHCMKCGSQGFSNTYSNCIIQGMFEAGTISFWYKLAAENGELGIYVDDDEAAYEGQATGWTFFTMEVSAGYHDIYITFNNWDSGTNSTDCAYLDDITLPTDYDQTDASGYYVNFDSGLLPAGTTNDPIYPWVIDDVVIPPSNNLSLRSTIEGLNSTTTTITFPEILMPIGGLFSVKFRVSCENADKIVIKINGVTAYSDWSFVEGWHTYSYLYNSAQSMIVSISYVKDATISLLDDNVAIASIRYGEITIGNFVVGESILSSESFGSPRLYHGLPLRNLAMTGIFTHCFGFVNVLPIWASVSCEEALSWLTDTMITYNGQERRIRSRVAPRQTITYRLLESRKRLDALLIAQYSGLSGNWVVPLWFESQLIGSVLPTALSIVVSTAGYSFRAASLAFLYESDDKWEVLEVLSVSANELILRSEVKLTYTNATLMPARLGLINTAISKNHSGFNAISTITYDIIDTEAVNILGTPAQFCGNDIYFDELLIPSASAAYNTSITTNIEEIDFDIGLFDKLTPWTYNRIARTVAYAFQGIPEISLFREYLERRAGRFELFWEPTFAEDLINLSTGLITTTLTVKNNGLEEAVNPRNHIAILDKNGNWYPRTVLTYTATTSSIELHLDASLDIEASDISLISYLGLKRFDTDKIALQWIGNGVVETTINVLEISP